MDLNPAELIVLRTALTEYMEAVLPSIQRQVPQASEQLDAVRAQCMILRSKLGEHAKQLAPKLVERAG